jgi:hypothetical protein
MNSFLGYWGHVFEYYVGRLFQTYAILAFNTVHLAPKYVDDPNKEICEVIVICGKTAVLLKPTLRPAHRRHDMRTTTRR